MSALPLRHPTGDESPLAATANADATASHRAASPSESADAEWSQGRPLSGAAPRELTVRALAVGLAIGAVLAAGNVYTGLKSTFIDGGALTATLLSFTFFATFKRLWRTPFGPYENNIAQTAAASAAVMTYVHGFGGPMPALMMMGQHHPAWALWAWGLALAIVGLAMGVALRRKLIVEEALPFPSGRATAELIKSVHADEDAAARRTRLLVVAALLAAALTWFRDGRPALIPQAFYLPLAVGGVTAASLTLGIGTSPLMAATGMFIGLRGALSLLAGGVVAWVVLAPLSMAGGWVKDSSYGSLAGWLVWPALGVMTGGTIVPLLWGWRDLARALARGVRDARNLSSRARDGGTDGAAAAPAAHERFGGRRAGVIIVVLASIALAWTGSRAFGFSPLLTVVVLLVSIALATVCARAAGETDVAPIGSMGTLAQVLFARVGVQSSIMSGAVVAGSATAVAQTMWTFKTGHALRASVRSQVVAHALGAVVGSLVVVPVYLLVTRVYPLGSERMPAVSALSWKATAEAMAGGLAGLPTHGLHAALGGFVVGAILALCQRVKIGGWLPSPTALGIGMIMPVSQGAAVVLGAGGLALARRRIPALANGEGDSLAAGLLAGESLVGVLIAALVATGVLQF